MPIPKRDEKALKTLVSHLRRAPHSVEEIQSIMDLSESSAYRWLRYLKADGLDVVSRREDGVVYYSVLRRRK